jgi:exopolysaccharide biosynthesis polyprenyl glycosylphosphotransferase
VFIRHHRKARVIFALCDLALIGISFALAYQVRQRLGLEREFFLSAPVQALLLGWSALIWIGLAFWWEIYDRIPSAHPLIILRDALRQTAAGAVAVILLEYTLRLDLSRPFLGLFAAFAWVLLCLFRLNAGRIVRLVRRDARHYVMVVGLNENARRLGEQLEQAAPWGVRLTGFIADRHEAERGEVLLSSAYPVHTLSELPELLRRHIIDEIVFAVDSRRLAELEEVFLLCDEEGVRTRVSVDFFPHVNSQVYLDRLGKAPLLTFSATPHDEIRLLFKRTTDVALAGAALLLLAPIMATVVILIRLTSPGPAIFRQVRCGLNGRRFVVLKFRSMCNNAEELKSQVAHLNRRETVFKIPDDPRLTSVGRWLRKFSIDEWPQLWNVLKGDMSLVGPRPAVPEEVELYKTWQRRRLRMRPGLTCLWAVSGRDGLDFETWMKMDMQYIDNWSLALDWKIMLRTIPHVLTGKGAH